MRTLAFIPIALALVAGPATAAAEPVPVPGDGASPVAQSTLDTFTESARLGAVGWLETELAYRASINAYESYDTELTLHTLDLLLGYPVRETMEFRVGWRMFGTVPGDDFDSIAGVGDPWFDGKFALTGLPDAANPHALSLLARFRPGIGQAPVTVPGATFEARALYTVRVGPSVELDANAGLAFNTDDNPSYVSLPVGGRVVWMALDWLDVRGEIVEKLHFTNLRGSTTEVGVGAGMRPVDAIELTLTGGLGLSESLPAGFLQLGVAFHTADFGSF